VNPAETVAWLLDREVIAEAEVTSRIIPDSFFECIEVVKAAIAEEEPVAVVIMGEFGGRSMVTAERIAQNLNDSARYGGLRDNAGVLLQDAMTGPEGPVAYLSTLPIRAMVEAIRAPGGSTCPICQK